MGAFPGFGANFKNVFRDTIFKVEIKLNCPNCGKRITLTVDKNKENSSYYCKTCHCLMQRMFI